ncbi:MAG: beta-ketoacyl-ACP synthase III [Filifactoraceae bacterium]
MGLRIIGTGSVLPANIKKNTELGIETDDEWIRSRTGIESRYVCVDESVSDLATGSAIRALENANIGSDELDLIICTTISAEYITPSLACIVQGRIGANCPAFDINVACTGFVYALNIASAFLESGHMKRILIVSAEQMSRLVDWSDKSTCILFGDGAGAVVVEEGRDLLSIKLTSSGDITPLKAANVIGNSPFFKSENSDTFIKMNGQDVYKFAVASICKDIKDVLDMANISEDEIDHVLTHQANIRIIDAAKGRLKIKEDKYFTNLHKYGNTSSASIPILMDEMNRGNLLKTDEVMVLSAFGSGLATGACVLRWTK